MVSIKTTRSSQLVEDNQDIVTSEKEFTMLQTSSFDHHHTNKETQDVMKGMCNSIDMLVWLLEAKFMRQTLAVEKGHQEKRS